MAKDAKLKVRGLLADNYKGAPGDGSKWIKGGERYFRGLYRGGSWNDEANALGSTRRIQLFQDSAPGGVRLVAVMRTATSRTDAANKKKIGP